MSAIPARPRNDNDWERGRFQTRRFEMTSATARKSNTGDAWTVAHEHTSVPFYMDGSLKAAVDLAP
jgi:hypothetical protein